MATNRNRNDTPTGAVVKLAGTDNHAGLIGLMVRLMTYRITGLMEKPMTYRHFKTGIEFKVGQKWRTGNGRLMTIKNFDHSEVYPIGAVDEDEQTRTFTFDGHNLDDWADDDDIHEFVADVDAPAKPAKNIKQMPLENIGLMVGQKWRTRDGKDIVTINTKYNDDAWKTYPFVGEDDEGNTLSFTAKGKHFEGDGEYDKDLVTLLPGSPVSEPAVDIKPVVATAADANLLKSTYVPPKSIDDSQYATRGGWTFGDTTNPTNVDHLPPKFTVGSQWTTRGNKRAMVLDVAENGNLFVYHYDEKSQYYHTSDGKALGGPMHMDLMTPYVEKRTGTAWLTITRYSDGSETVLAHAHPDKPVPDAATIAIIGPITWTEGEGM